MSSDESLTRAEELLARVEAVRAELEQLAEGEAESPERAIELLAELSELAKAVEEELTRAQRAAEADAGA
jgi:alpha-D-ribose 1-methylphosphonate 5-triphosphate synthase subunit PhnH